MNTSGRLLVTGAAGFIGGHIAEVLYLTGHPHVRAGVRTWSSSARIGRFPLDIIKCDLMSLSDIESALDGVSAVVHCAVGSRAVICQGTRNLLQVALAKGVCRVVHLSSTAVYGNATGVVDETRQCQYTGDEYADAKIDAENACRKFAERGLPIVILRPPIVYGPYSKYWTVNVVRSLASRRLGSLNGAASGKCNLLFVHDLVRATVMALENDRAPGQAFNINGPEVITWNEYFRRISESLGLSGFTTRSTFGSRAKAYAIAPARALGLYVRDNHMETVKKIAARWDVARSLMKRAAEVLSQTPSMADLRLYGQDAVYDATKAKEVLGFVPRFGVDEGLRITAKWVKHESCL